MKTRSNKAVYEEPRAILIVYSETDVIRTSPETYGDEAPFQGAWLEE